MDAVEQLRAHEDKCAERHQAITERFEAVTVRFEAITARFEAVTERLAKLETATAYHGKMLWAVLGVVIISLARDAIAPLVG